ncbi:helix-turn-helix domain-containing protein [Ruminococcus flavefaciens]|uniref:helix-turn-helix domain-containing protein n=1 Tax=Ruminococcus flavefaciens TaxID=1265 RepID=UPI0026EAA8E9|nr:helix-turn-helix transcriptional regulator [Ruminococcus flavefaciens]
MKDNRKTIGTRINAALALRNVTQKELADHLKVKPNVISYFCCGSRTPNTEQIIIIAEYLNVTTDYLLGRFEAPTIDENYQTAIKVTGLSQNAVVSLEKWSTPLFFKDKPINSKTFPLFCEMLENGDIQKLSRFIEEIIKASSEYIEKANSIKTSVNYPDITLGDLEDLKEADKNCRLIRYDMSNFIMELQNKYDDREKHTELKLDHLLNDIAGGANNG